MRVFKTSYRDRTGRQREAASWYIELQDASAKTRRLPAFPDKKASQEFGRKVERLVSLRVAGEQPDTAMRRWLDGLPEKHRNRLAKIGLLDSRSVASAKPLRIHLADYKQAVLDGGATVDYAQKTVNRVSTILDGTGIAFLSDLDAAVVSRFLAERRAAGLSVKSSNHYLAAAKGFVSWLVKERRASENPLAHLSAMNANANRKHVRRPLEADELIRLLAVTRAEPDRFGMSGVERYWLYRLAVETGLRAGELRSLLRASFSLEGSEPTVTIEASAAKNRRTATLPLRQDTAAELRSFLASKLPTADVFCLPRPEKIVVMLRGDLKAAGIPYADDAGRVVDSHALRVTFASLLLRGGWTCGPPRT